MNVAGELIVAIPHYNMSESANILVGQLWQRGFRRIYILDDNSREDEQIRLASIKQAKPIFGETNLGAAGNRNRILDVVSADDCLVVFLDADTELVDDNFTPKQVTGLFKSNQNPGIMGLKVLNNDGSWGAFNYGPIGLARWLLTAPIQAFVKNHPLKGWPNTAAQPVKIEVGWLVETGTVMQLSVFRQLGGYDKSLRYCEAIDMGRRLDMLGLRRVFEPGLTIRHLQINNRGLNRYKEVLQSVVKLIAKRV